MFKNKTILITGGTGTFGQAFTREILTHDPLKVIIYSRDEFKQFNMAREFDDYRMRYFIGDVRDAMRLKQAMRDVDYVVHAAALKQVPACEYNPFEAVQTNVFGAMNVIEASIANKVKKVVALSTDKSVHPINLYGATKLCSDKIFISGNNLSPKDSRTVFSIVRYGNVACSRGSVIPVFKKLCQSGGRILPVTDTRMTRFYIDIDRAVNLVFTAFANAHAGDTFIAKIPSFRIMDLVSAFGCEPHVIGIRHGEKLHEVMITSDDSPRTYDMGDYYVVLPAFHDWTANLTEHENRVQDGFIYSSDNNTMLTVSELGNLCKI